MATTGGGAAAPLTGSTVAKVTEPAPAPGPVPRPAAAPAFLPASPTVESRLLEEGFAFDFFQAVRLLERLEPGRRPVGREGPPAAEVVRFHAHLSLAFPPSSIYEIERPRKDSQLHMTVAFMGLTGPSGVLPRHYTELLLRLEREAKGPEKRALRAWLDLFNHRLISLFYRAWEKYRFFIPYERGDHARDVPDPFTQALYCLVGLGTPHLRNRLKVTAWEEVEDERRHKVLARLDDLGLLHYSGFLSHRPRNAFALEALLRGYFNLPVRVRQFQGQWLRLQPENRSRMGEGGCNNQLGVNVVAGDRVWDVQSKFRLRLGPVGYAQFNEFLPDRSPVPARKALFLLAHLTRLYAGPEFDFDVQLVLRKEEVPECQLAPGEGGPRLGWNTWVRSLEFDHDADDAVFAGEEVFVVGPGAEAE